MATLGNSTLPGSGYWFDDFGNKEFWTTRLFTVPAGGATVTDMYVYVGGHGGSATIQMVIWDNTNAIVWNSGNITAPAGSVSVRGQGWVHASVPSIVLAAGTYSFGFWTSGHVIWTFQSSGGVRARSGLGSPGNNTGTSSEYGSSSYGELGCYITYTPGGTGGIIYINTGTAGSPIWTQADALINTGTPGSPVWTQSDAYINTGTPGSPNWVLIT